MVFHFLHLLMLAIFFLVLPAPKAMAGLDPKDPDWCRLTLASIGDRLRSISMDEVIPQAAVAIKGKTTGKDGFPRYILERIGSRWSSSFEQFSNAPEGDPRSFLILFGPKAGRKFGFELHGDRRLIVPSAEELNAAIHAYNKGNPHRKIKLRFYTPETQEKMTDLAFLARYAFQSELPIATHPSLLLHDISYHSTAIAIPNIYIHHSQKQVRFLIQFIKQLRETTSLQNKKWVNDFIEITLDYFANNIDAGSANIMNSYLNISYNTAYVQQSAALKKNLLEWTKVLTSNGKSPVDALTGLARFFIDKYNGDIPTTEGKEFIKTFRQFTEQNISDPDFSTALNPEHLKPESIAKSLYENIKAIERYGE